MATQTLDAHRPSVSYLDAAKGWKNWAYTLDHKRIGVMYLIAVSLALLVGGIFAMLIRIELFAPGKTIMTGRPITRCSRSTASSWSFCSSFHPYPRHWVISSYRS